MEEIKVKALEPETTEEAEPVVTKDQKSGFKKVGVSGRPEWCKAFPPGFQIPKGKRPIFMRFRPEWTDAPHLGEFQCVTWGITVGEEHIADRRADDSGSRAIHERAKLSIRLLCTGESPTLLAADASKSVPEADVDLFWENLGVKCRTILTQVYIHTHSLDEAERRDFFENCVEVRDAV